MSKKALILIGLLFSFIVLGMFIFAYVYSTDEVEDVSTIQLTQLNDDATAEVVLNNELVLSQEFLLGTHSIKGDVSVPVGCYEYEQSYIIAESYPEQVTLTLEINKSNADCAVPLDALPIEFIIQASEQAVFTLRINDQQKPLTLMYE